MTAEKLFNNMFNFVNYNKCNYSYLPPSTSTSKYRDETPVRQRPTIMANMINCPLITFVIAGVGDPKGSKIIITLTKIAYKQMY